MAAGKTYGVAQKAIVYSVRVLGCSGRGSYSVVIDGVNHAVSHANETGRRGIISMSLGGPTSLTLNAALRNAIAAGVPAVVAAGNGYSNACTRSPAGVTEAITVGSSTINDDASSFSNFGGCVDIFAPGSSITGADYLCTTCTKTISGTSMATPMVSGAVALMLQLQPSLTPPDIASLLITLSTKDVLNLDTLHYNSRFYYTPNRLLFVRSKIGTYATYTN